jgi:hypothetical protein
LRIPNNFPNSEKIKIVDEIIGELGLTKCKNTLIGTPGKTKGISGGERKRYFKNNI